MTLFHKLSITFGIVSAAAGLIAGGAALAFEDTQTLPQGVRNLSMRSLHTDIGEKTDAHGVRHELADPLRKELTFANLLDKENGFKKKQLEAFLADNDFAPDAALGEFTANMKGQLDVMAPIMAYGITESLTLAVAVPFYHGQMGVATGFEANATGEKFVAALTDNYKHESARNAANGINNAVAKLNEKLLNNGFHALGPWEGKGIGDVTVLAKWRAYENAYFKAATFSGVVAPTGAVDDPDILNDTSFGDGSWDAIVGFAVDEPVWGPVFMNQYAKYNYQFASRKAARLVEEDEVIEVPVDEVSYKPGDKVEAGVSVQLQGESGLQSGFGYVYSQKAKDEFSAGESSRYLEAGTATDALSQEFLVGYSTVPHFKAGRFALPMRIKLGLQRHLESHNMPVTDLYKVDFDLYF